MHLKARSPLYPQSSVNRQSFKDEFISWDTDFPEYNPPSYTAPSVAKGPVWADKEYDGKTCISTFNCFDEALKVNRVSHLGVYKIINGLPQNPVGRTGITGRGLLGRYGPNHAADPIVTRWEVDEDGNVLNINKKPVLQFIAVCRLDTGDWAIPGGMVDPGEHVSRTLKREFSEEVLFAGSNAATNKEEITARISYLFASGGVEVFRGYCDDIRNTDCAWMETVAMNFHDKDSSVFNGVDLKAGDEASGAQWKRIDRNLKLYASHEDYIKKVAELHGAHY